MTEKQKTVAAAVFAIYCVLLAWLILFKLTLHVEYLKMPSRHVEFVPFAPRSIGWRQAAREMLANFLAFLPLGAYLTAFFAGKKGRVLAAAGIGCAVSLVFEIVQYAFAIGAADVTDLLMNTAGALAGALILLVMERIFKGRAVSVLNGLGIAGAVLFFALAIAVGANNL